MKEKKRKIQFYEGHRGEEIPIKFQYRGKEIIIKEIISSGYIGSQDPKKSIDRFFDVRGEDEKNYRIFYISDFEEWIVLEKT